MRARAICLIFLCLMCSLCRKQHDDAGGGSRAQHYGRQIPIGKGQFTGKGHEISRADDVGSGTRSNADVIKVVQRAQGELAELKGMLRDAYANDGPRSLTEVLSRAARVIDAAAREDRYNLISYFGFAVKYDRDCQVADIAFCSPTEVKASEVVSNYVTYAQAIAQWHLAKNNCPSGAANTIADMMETLEGMRPYCVCGQRNWPMLGKVIDDILEACKVECFEKENSVGHVFWGEMRNLAKVRSEGARSIDDDGYRRKKKCFEAFANRMGRKPKWMTP